MRGAVLIVALVMSGCAYKAGSFHYSAHEFGGQRATVGCLDISVERRTDTDDAAVLAYEFGNRCDEPAMVDLVYAQVRGRSEAGGEVVLAPYDPHSVMRPMRMDGRTFGNEAIAYATDHPLTQICVDVATIAHVSGSQVLCLSAAPPLLPTPAAPVGTEPQPQAHDGEAPPAKPTTIEPLDQPNQLD